MKVCQGRKCLVSVKFRRVNLLAEEGERKHERVKGT